MSWPAQADLNRLLSFQQQGDPGAFVSSGFHDWRTTSKYRSRAGLHAGYDIAMLANSPVRAAWSGKVVAIVPWYGREFGVTVQDEAGYEATYGHIAPSVLVGQAVNPGDILGVVVVDHVDVKMKNANGSFVDFAQLELPSLDVPSGRSPNSVWEEERAKAIERYQEVEKAWSRKSLALKHGLASIKEVNELKAEMDRLTPLVGLQTKTTNPPLPPAEDLGRPLTDRLLNATAPVPDFLSKRIRATPGGDPNSRQ